MKNLSKAARKKSEQFGGRIRDVRMRRDITLEQLSEVSGVSVSTLKKVEKGDPGVGLGYYLATIEVYGMISELDGLVTEERDYTGLTPDKKRASGIGSVKFDVD